MLRSPSATTTGIRSVDFDLTEAEKYKQKDKDEIRSNTEYRRTPSIVEQKKKQRDRRRRRRRRNNEKLETTDEDEDDGNGISMSTTTATNQNQTAPITRDDLRDFLEYASEQPLDGDLWKSLIVVGLFNTFLTTAREAGIIKVNSQSPFCCPLFRFLEFSSQAMTQWKLKQLKDLRDSFDSWIDERSVRWVLQACYESNHLANADSGRPTIASETTPLVPTSPTGGADSSQYAAAASAPATDVSTAETPPPATTPATGGAGASPSDAAASVRATEVPTAEAVTSPTPATGGADSSPSASAVSATTDMITTGGVPAQEGDVSSLSEDSPRSGISPDVSIPTHGSDATDRPEESGANVSGISPDVSIPTHGSDATDRFTESGANDMPPTCPPRSS